MELLIENVSSEQATEFEEQGWKGYLEVKIEKLEGTTQKHLGKDWVFQLLPVDVIFQTTDHSILVNFEINHT